MTKHHPLAPPDDEELLQVFLKYFHLPGDIDRRALLRDVARAFVQLPYENLTKIIRQAEVENPQLAKRGPAEVISDHVSLGAGGTCFSLTAALLHLVRSLGFCAEPILADRKYGPDTHCALLVWIEEEPHLVDPGYLIVDPIPLGKRSQRRIETSFNRVILSPSADGDRLDLHTEQQGDKRYRLSFKPSPVDASEFLKAWDASFDWDMMRYPLLSRIAGSEQFYMRSNYFQIRTADEVRRRELAPEEVSQWIVSQFGIDPKTALHALVILQRRGEL